MTNELSADQNGAPVCTARPEIGLFVYLGLVFVGLVVYQLIRTTRAARRLAAELEAERSQTFWRRLFGG
jgi:hypothetical protein